MRGDRALIVVAWTKRPDDGNADSKDARGSWLRWQSAAITTSTDLREANSKPKPGPAPVLTPGFARR